MSSLKLDGGGCYNISGAIQESKSIGTVFQKKGQTNVEKWQNIWEFGQKCTKFEKGQLIVCDNQMQ